MANFTLLYNDEASQVSYYYNLDDRGVYQEKKQINNATITKIAGIGAFAGAFMYPYIGESRSPQVPILLFGIVVVIGILLGWIFIFWLNHTAANKVFISENKIILTQAEIRELYNKGKKARKSYWVLFGGWTIFSTICSLLFCYTAMNVLLFLSCIILWYGVGALFFAARPICRMRFRKFFSKEQR